MANAINEARKAIEARFTAEFTDLTNKVFTDNKKEFAQDTGQEWARLSVQHTGRIQETIGRPGNRLFRTSGSVFIQIFTPIGGDNAPVGQEMKRSDELASKAADVFDAVSFEGLDFDAATTREAGPEGKWFTVLVEAPFEYDEIR